MPTHSERRMLMLEMFLAAVEALAKVRSNANRTLKHSNASQGPVFPTLKERKVGNAVALNG